MSCQRSRGRKVKEKVKIHSQYEFEKYCKSFLGKITLSRNGTHLATVNLLPEQGKGRALKIAMIASIAVFYYWITRIWILWLGSTRFWTDLWRLLWRQGWLLWRGTRLPRWANRYTPAIKQLLSVSFLDRLPEGRNHEGGDAGGSKHDQLALWCRLSPSSSWGFYYNQDHQ